MKIGAAFSAIRGGLGDVFGRLALMAILCVIGAAAATGAAAWGAFTYVLPLIPEGTGFWGAMLDLADWLAGAGIVVLAIALSPGISMMIGSALFDVAAGRVEKAVGVPPGRMVPLGEGLANGLRIGLPALGLNLLALPILFVPVANIVVFLLLNGGLMGREFFSLAAVRRMSWKEASDLRKKHPLPVLIVGLAAALFPFVAPLFGAAAMTRLIAASKTDTSSAS
ncbi:MAG: EI24 domain-containing protein [Hyphomonadaceae bacterium]|nr:EI24 domain-containing protein [Hyphomonadaceae bacterium]